MFGWLLDLYSLISVDIFLVSVLNLKYWNPSDPTIILERELLTYCNHDDHKHCYHRDDNQHLVSVEESEHHTHTEIARDLADRIDIAIRHRVAGSAVEVNSVQKLTVHKSVWLNPTSHISLLSSV
jgi:hypothetical protein